MKLKKLIDILEFFYPTHLAEEWDNVGLIIGDENKEIARVLTALEITEEVVEEAISRDVNLIISHHPLIFKSIKKLDYNDSQTRLIIKLIQEDIAVYSMHTNVDIANNGMNDWLSNLIEMKKIKVLEPTKMIHYKKITIETIEPKMYEIIESLKKASVGRKGKLIENVNITPTVKHSKYLNGKNKQVDALILESYVSEENLQLFTDEMYKLGVFNYQISSIENMNDIYGIGRMGDINPQLLEELAYGLKERFGLNSVKIVGNREKLIKKVAVVGGSGSSYLNVASKNKCDVLITGDVGFHIAQDALANDIAIIDIGHNVEIIFNDIMAEFLKLFDGIEVFSSEVDVEPFEVL